MYDDATANSTARRSRELRPDQIKDAPYYWPNLIAELAAAIGAVGSIGPWIASAGNQPQQHW